MRRINEYPRGILTSLFAIYGKSISSILDASEFRRKASDLTLCLGHYMILHKSHNIDNHKKNGCKLVKLEEILGSEFINLNAAIRGMDFG